MKTAYTLSIKNIYSVFLPDSAFTQLTVLEVYHRVAHSSVNATLTELSSKYWIRRGRQVLRRILKDCIICKRVRVKTLIGPPPPTLSSS